MANKETYLESLSEIYADIIHLSVGLTKIKNKLALMYEIMDDDDKCIE